MGRLSPAVLGRKKSTAQFVLGARLSTWHVGVRFTFYTGSAHHALHCTARGPEDRGTTFVGCLVVVLVFLSFSEDDSPHPNSIDEL